MQIEPPDTPKGGTASVVRPVVSVDFSKAGMKGADKARVAQVVEELSRGSPFYLNEQRKQKKRDERIAAMREQWVNIECDMTQLTKYNVLADRLLSSITKKREDDLASGGCFLHVDMDMFFAAVEMRDNPALRDVPMAVGGMGMLSTSNYKAREYGVRAAMPGYIAKKLCPELVFAGDSTSYERYRVASSQMKEVLGKYDANFASLGCDEATLNITHLVQCCTEDNLDRLNEIATAIRSEICEKTNGLTASIGIGSSPMLCKLAGNVNKPNGQKILLRREERVFVDSMPVRTVTGIGKVTQQFLSSIGVETCGGILVKRAQIAALFSPCGRESLFWVYAGGEIKSHVGGYFGDGDQEGRKSISHETTFRQLTSSDQLIEKVVDLVEQVVGRMVEEKIMGRTVTIKAKSTSFEVKQYSSRIDQPTNAASVVKSVALQLMRRSKVIENFKELRLIGVRVGTITKATNKQRTLFDVVPSAKKKELSNSPTRISVAREEKSDLEAALCVDDFLSDSDHSDCEVSNVENDFDDDVTIVTDEAARRRRRQARDVKPRNSSGEVVFIPSQSPPQTPIHFTNTSSLDSGDTSDVICVDDCPRASRQLDHTGISKKRPRSISIE